MDFAADPHRAMNGWAPPAPEELSRLIPGYEVLSLLGRGGMGAVYLALQTALDRSVALKILPVESSASQAFAQRFTREARAMARLQHPHIVPVYDSGCTSAGHLYFAMEFIDGKNLDMLIHGVRAEDLDRAPQPRGLPVAQALDIAAQVSAALVCAHGQGIVHRDIKPANILVDAQGVVKVADFGIALVTDPEFQDLQTTRTGTVIGSMNYIAPEQSRGEHVDLRADLYSLGVMLYEMLCGEVPRGVFTPPSQRIGCSEKIDRIVHRALRQEPALRYQDATALKADLDAVRMHLQGLRPVRKRQVKVMAAAALLAIGFVAWRHATAPTVTNATPSTPPVVQANAAKNSPAEEMEAYRRFAEWVFLVGDSQSFLMGKLTGSNERVRIDTKSKIPTVPWKVVELWLDRSLAPPDHPPVLETEFIAHLAGLKDLENVFFRDLQVSDDAYAFLANNAKLRVVCVERSEVGDELLGHLTGLEALTILRINTSAKFSGHGLEKLRCFPILEEASFYWTAAGDDVAEVLGKCPKLRALHLERTAITDSGLAKLAAIPTLQSINLTNTGVSTEAVAAFQRALPACEVLR